MSTANYSFLPWLRRGISNQITTPEGQSRATVEVQMTLNETETLPAVPVQLIGPGDITGINSNVILRTEPRNRVTDFEPNYFSFIEFYDEDFPWRYTPATPFNRQLAPWLNLLLLKEDEFERTTDASRPLTSIKLLATPSTVFPEPSQTWAWAHVHVNDNVSATNYEPDNTALDAQLNSNPDLAVSRLFGSRKLEENTAYYAFLIPAFETGRKSGLGEEVADTEEATTASWDLEDSTQKEYPIYYEWYFRTGFNGDFEYLVGLLEARTMDASVGIRDIDTHEPGFGLDTLSDNAILGLEGALKAPSTAPKDFSDIADKDQFEEQVATIINLQDDLKKETNNATPVVSPPFYGQWHALVSRLSIDPADENWINHLNKDPRNRATAGLGTKVVQKKQDTYLKAAWQQVGSILSANQKIRYAQLAKNAGQMLFEKYVVNLSSDEHLLITKPVQKKVMGSPTTIYYQVQQSAIPAAVFSGAFRRLIRPGAAFAKKLQLPSLVKKENGLLIQLNNGLITAASPKSVPADILNSDAITDKITNTSPVNPFAKWIANNPWWYVLIILILLVILFLVTGNWTITGSAALASVGIYLYVKKAVEKKEAEISIIKTVSSGGLTNTAIAAIAPTPSFTITAPGTVVTPGSSIDPAIVAKQTSLFKDALMNFSAILQFPVPQPPTKPLLDLANAQSKINLAIQPSIAIPKRILPNISIGGVVLESFDPVMAYPDIKNPMYEPLRDLSSEFLIPNLNLIPQNTISLLETNQPFIEAYMTGLNHEFARELLWNEYPTDQRGTYFRQFWDVSRTVNTEGISEEELAEKLKDITPIDTWTKSSELGDHNNRDTSVDSAQLVLVIRGDVLKKYPNTVIYAQRAAWDTDDPKLVINETGGGGLEDTNILYPAYSASVNPDITFLGFDLSIEEARGLVATESESEKNSLGDRDLGWFFILKEVPGEPRFGLDMATGITTATNSWDDLSWDNLDPETTCVDLSKSITANVSGDIQWGTNSADMAYILYQKPVMIAVHAKDMLASV